MQKIEFDSPEYQQDGCFKNASYLFDHDEKSGWIIKRNGQAWLAPGQGYVPVKVIACGICATDLARRYLPFALPQITGHEVVGEYQGKYVAIEINASHRATGHQVDFCPYCETGLDSHCPERLTLGIDRLPGGFSPWVLAPVNSIHTLPEAMSPEVGVMIEPFAAALKAVAVTPPVSGQDVAVLGPRRLGMLILAVLSAYRKQTGIDFKISAIVRHAHLSESCINAGTDEVVTVADCDSRNRQFDIVYDTTGNSGGFAQAIKLSQGVVHLKSTHGQAVQGLDYLTDMVINEQSVFPLDNKNIARHLSKLKGVKNIYFSPSINEDLIHGIKLEHHEVVCYQGAASEMFTQLKQDMNKDCNSIKQFDLAFVTNLKELDQVLRVDKNKPGSLLKPTGKLFLSKEHADDKETLLSRSILQRNIQIHTSRCGDFAAAIDMLRQNPETINWLQHQFVTHIMPLDAIAEAFVIAADSTKSKKVVIKPG
ncbi:MAG: alcohol dehydrogenase catalytic domain-containing protein [Gammaproteobacteria bacterium]|nr:alcohol dehydrogenase catalytic domain-containing protein [Gammaproteobacteria bacterium]MDH5776825.1 alcohol dehydrogenase catalytic domain-containing protein [Gammaproteobacteria bacterium]